MSTAPEAPEDWFGVVQRIRDGDPVALAKLSALITSLLYRQGAYRVRESWEDICQDVLAALVRSVERGALREPRAFVGYTYTLTRNYFLDFLHRRQRVTSGGRRDETSVRAPLDDSADAPGDSSHPDVLLDLERALDALPPRGRRVIEEIYLRGRTYQEVADRLEIPLGTVKRLQTNGLRVLREVLHRQDHETDPKRRRPAAPGPDPRRAEADPPR